MMRFLPLGDDQMDLLRLRARQDASGGEIRREGERRGVTDDGFARKKNQEGWEGVDGHQKSTVGLRVQSPESESQEEEKKREKLLLDSNLGKRCLRSLIDLIVLNLDLAQELYASDDDSTRTGEDEVCCGKNSTAEHSKQSTCTRIYKGTSSNNWLKSKKFKVFEDCRDDHQIEIPGLMTKWDDLGTLKSNQRQNLI
ncbi:hypothetical protein PPACK8108_LOCUS24889 [Phakopsora pachyrhizi]|uniref:Uncharacterized protein n=1 Tax=Phakopsora pachyrhizi TaxID=170000 RepID=A0AAV0BST8_PHAPC|nr:hypothetical protein PPACK8108_LOCUS24889 [Phakopsora pachyrhizi]